MVTNRSLAKTHLPAGHYPGLHLDNRIVDTISAILLRFSFASRSPVPITDDNETDSFGTHSGNLRNVLDWCGSFVAYPLHARR